MSTQTKRRLAMAVAAILAAIGFAVVAAGPASAATQGGKSSTSSSGNEWG